MDKYNHKKIDSKWQDYWEKNKLFEAIDFDTPRPLDKLEAGRARGRKNKQYILVEFPYPSGEGLHVGHCRPFVALDIIARKRRMEGFNVLYPIGWDAFGLPTENYAIKTGIHPSVATKKNTDNFRRQLKSIGFSFDWSREINTTDPKYYRWTQWIFLQLYKNGLAYKAKMPINFCPSCKIGLANEEVINGKCERCGTEVAKKEIEQWMLGITKYADRLIDDLDKVDYLDKIKRQQINWIGKSESTQIDFRIKDSKKKITIITTRADTIFGATFIVLAPEHELVRDLSGKIKNYQEVKDYINQSLKKTDFERGMLAKEKTGVKLEGIKAINPVNSNKLPVYISDFVLIGYGTGAIMSVPAHDERDFEFAKKFNIPIIPVVEKQKEGKLASLLIQIYDDDNSNVANELRKIGEAREYMTPTVRLYEIPNKKISRVIEILKDARIGNKEDFILVEKGRDFTLEIRPKSINFLEVYTGDGKHINSDFLNGLRTDKAIQKINKWLVSKGIGKPTTTYRLRDWVFSRQHYWGEPIPMVFCSICKKRIGNLKPKIPNPKQIQNSKHVSSETEGFKIQNYEYNLGEILNPGWVAVDENDLPVELPMVEKYQPTETGESPLANISDWVNTKCPKCGGEALRETDTMPNWAGSSWYYLAYILQGNPKSQIPNPKNYWDKKRIEYWMPVDLYNGGMEHTTLHLLYSRFWYKFLYDIKVVPTDEPYQKRTSHGFVLGEGGIKMSKSRGNVINPDEIVDTHGADTLRLYEMFIGPFGERVAWDTKGILGARRFLDKVWKLFKSENKNPLSNQLKIKLNQTIKKVTDDIENFGFNTAVSAMMEFVNEAQTTRVQPSQIRDFLLILSPFAPHISEELWSKLGCKGSTLAQLAQKWPKADKKYLIDEEITIVVQVNGKLRDTIKIKTGSNEKEVIEAAKSSPNAKKYLAKNKIKKEIYIKDRLVNFVI